MDRRTFLVGAGGATLALLHARTAVADDAAWHVLYPGTTTREEAAERLDLLASKLGPDVAQRLQVARRGGTFVVIYDRAHLKTASDKATAETVARRHAELLRGELDDDGPLATIVSSAELLETWNIRYGEPASSVDKLKKAFQTVGKMLGSGVGKSLVIERLADGTHQLVYRRNGDRASTEKVAAHHASLLRSSGLVAVAVRDAYEQVAFDGATAESCAPAPTAPPAKRVEAPMEAADGPATVELAVDEPQDTGAMPVDAAVTPLRDLINVHVQKMRGQGLVSAVERTAWVVYDLAADQLLAAINADVPMQAASMIKPFVAVAFFHQVEAGKLKYGDETKLQMEHMIRDSSNSATNGFIELLGGPAATMRVLRKHYADITQQFDLVEYIPSGGRTYQNKASAMDHARLLRALWKDGLPYADELRRVMNLPGPDRLYRDVPQIPAGTQVYDKTGTTAMCCGDMGILVARTKAGMQVPYILVGVIDRTTRASQYGSWSRTRGDVIRSVSGLTYTWMRSLYDFV